MNNDRHARSELYEQLLPLPPSKPTDAGRRLRLVMELFEDGKQIMRQKLLRAHPELGEHAIDELLVRWLHDRPGALHGDVSGPVAYRFDLDSHG